MSVLPGRCVTLSRTEHLAPTGAPRRTFASPSIASAVRFDLFNLRPDLVLTVTCWPESPASYPAQPSTISGSAPRPFFFNLSSSFNSPSSPFLTSRPYSNLLRRVPAISSDWPLPPGPSARTATCRIAFFVRCRIIMCTFSTNRPPKTADFAG